MPSHPLQSRTYLKCDMYLNEKKHRDLETVVSRISFTFHTFTHL